MSFTVALDPALVEAVDGYLGLVCRSIDRLMADIAEDPQHVGRQVSYAHAIVAAGEAVAATIRRWANAGSEGFGREGFVAVVEIRREFDRFLREAIAVKEAKDFGALVQ